MNNGVPKSILLCYEHKRGFQGAVQGHLLTTAGSTASPSMEQAPTGRSAGSLAWAGLANTYFWIDPTRGIGGVYLSQVLPFADKKSLPLCGEFEMAVYKSIG